MTRRCSHPLIFLLRHLGLYGVVALCLWPVRSGFAQEPRWALDAEAQNEVPIGVGAGLTLEVPGRFRLGTSIGIVPSPYVDLINAVSTEFEFYDQSTADLISDALERSLVWTVRAGWRPFSRRGLYVDAGYSTINLGGRATSDDVLSAYLSGQRLPTIPALASDMPYDIDATLQMARVEAGWVVWLSDLYLRIAVGGAFTMASNTVIDPGQSGSAQVDSSRQTIATKAGQYLDDTFTTYVHTGTLTLTLGYRVLGPRQK